MFFDLALAVKVAFVAMAVSPVPPILPGKQLTLGGRARYVYGLLVAASVAAVVLVPCAVEILARLFHREAHIGVGVVARLVGATVLLPLVVGLAVRHFAPGPAERVGPWASRVGTVLLVAGLLPILVAAWPGVVSLIGDGAILAMAVVVAAGLAAGHWLGGPNPDDRTALAIASSMRHPGVALAIARLNFPQEKLVAAAVLLFLLVSVIMTLPYGAWRKRVHAGLAAGAR
jgi:BASS family bile acid:Na+ symporter